MTDVNPWRGDLLVGFHELFIGVTKLHLDGHVPCVQYGPFREQFQVGPVLQMQ
jgi:hypothetical protein